MFQDNMAEVNLGQSLHCVWTLNKNLLHALDEAKTSLYLSMQSSLKRNFILLMWDDRWILRRKGDKQITGELRITPSQVV